MHHDEVIKEHVITIIKVHLLCLIKASRISKENALEIFNVINDLDLRDRADEDIHYLIERTCIEKLGVEKAGQLNLGKSRNDQVATAIRMELKERVTKLLSKIVDFESSLLSLSKRYLDSVFPSYTHMQRAQPIALSYHFLSYFDSLSRCFQRGLELYERIDLCPYGSAALAGTTVPIDRRFAARLLGFKDIVQNGIDGVSSRDFVLEALALNTIIGLDLARICEEIILWSTSEFDFVDIPDELAATSSIMPHKKNQVVAEIIRARCSSLVSDFIAAHVILKGLPYSYNLDLQEITPHIWNSFNLIFDCLDMVSRLVLNLSFKTDKIESSVLNDFAVSSFLAEYLASELGIPFRVAYTAIGEIIRKVIKENKEFVQELKESLPDLLKEYTGREVILDEQFFSILNPKNAMKRIKTEGGSNPDFLVKDLNKREKIVVKQKEKLIEISKGIENSRKLLESEVRSLLLLK